MTEPGVDAAHPGIEERAHALLSASGSKIWLSCTPSARFQDQFPNPDSVFSREGTWAHSVAAHRLETYLGRIHAESDREEDIEGYAEFSNAANHEAIQAYVNRCIHAIAQARRRDADALILLEQRLDYSEWVPEGFGTGDLVIISNHQVHIRDLKFGVGVRVDASDNTQLMLYAAGALSAYRGLYDFDHVVVEIDQPRLNHLDGLDEPISVTALHDWLEKTVRPAAQQAFRGEGEFVPGEHCRWCRGRQVCAARAESMRDLVDKQFEEEDVSKLTEEQIAAYVPRLAGLIQWANDLQNLATARAMSGHKWPGLKLVAGRSIRKIKDPEGLALALEMEGIDRAMLYELPEPPPLLGIGALEKIVGKKQFAAISKDYVDKPPGKPALVPLGDKREEYVPSNADADFGEGE